MSKFIKAFVRLLFKRFADYWKKKKKKAFSNKTRILRLGAVGADVSPSS